jgi:hypothetical protein
MTDHNQLSLDDIAYTADVNLFLKTLARIVARVFGRSESDSDNEDHKVESVGQAEDKE